MLHWVGVNMLLYTFATGDRGFNNDVIKFGVKFWVDNGCKA